jgi:hypothetical protein
MNETVELSGAVAETGRSRVSVVLLGLLGAGLLLAMVWFLFLVPDGTEPPVDPDLAAAADADAVEALPTSDGVDDELALEPLPVTTYDVYLARDPFEPVVEPPSGSTSEGGVTTADGSSVVPVVAETTVGDGSTTDVSGTDGAVAPAPGDDPGDPDGAPVGGGPAYGDVTTSGTCVGQEELVCDGRVVTLQSVTMRNGERVAVVQVDTDIYEVAHGEIFAGSFRVVEFASDGSVLLQYGEAIYPLAASRDGGLK